MLTWPHVTLIVLMGVATYATRVGFIGLAERIDLHPLVQRALEYVPVSILAALVFPAVFAPTGQAEQPLTNPYVWAAVATALLLWVTQRQWLAIVLGVASLVVLRRFM